MSAYLTVKRIADLLLSFTGLVLLMPLFLLISLCIKLDSKGPVIFKQKRVGKDETLFPIYKFRTMHEDTPKDMPTHLLERADKQITRVGKILRKTSLDELPQLINILLGHMSLVGPRPALWNQDDLIVARRALGVNKVRPGLTGWAQINGRDELPIEEKAELDAEYVNRMSVLFDLKILFLTLYKVIKFDGYREGKPATMQRGERAIDK